MARSEWPRGRWLVAYSDMWGTTKTLREAKRHVDIRLGALLRQPGPVRLAIPINAVIVRVGSEVAYRGRIYGTKHKRMHWTRVRPADPVRIVVIPPPGKAAQVRRALGIKDRGRKR